MFTNCWVNTKPNVVLVEQKKRWGEDPDAFNGVIECFCSILDPRSFSAPMEVLKKTVGLLLQCLELEWEYRPNLKELLSTLEELEGSSTKVYQLSNKTEERFNYLSVESTKLKIEMEVLVASQVRLREYVREIEESAKRSKMKMLELRQEMLTVADLRQIEDLQFLCEDVKTLKLFMKEGNEKKTRLQMELSTVEKNITKNRIENADMEEAFEETKKNNCDFV